MNEPRLFLMRHGRTDANDAGLVQGCGDLPLNATGRTEVGTTADALRPVAIQEVWSSPQRRARESACLVAADLDLEHAMREDARLD